MEFEQFSNREAKQTQDHAMAKWNKQVTYLRWLIGVFKEIFSLQFMGKMYWYIYVKLILFVCYYF